MQNEQNIGPDWFSHCKIIANYTANFPSFINNKFHKDPAIFHFEFIVIISANILVANMNRFHKRI